MSGILTLNAGSSSLKFAVYRRAADEPQLHLLGQIDGIGRGARLVLGPPGAQEFSAVTAQTQEQALQAALTAIKQRVQGLRITGVGHRIVHGGRDFTAPVELSPPALLALTELIPLAPLHQPHNLAGVAAAQAAFPGALQVGCFDTGFHRGQPWVHDTFALPRALYDQGVRRYGFHGLSYDYITTALAAEHPRLHAGRVIIAHLGNGASMTAVQGGQSMGSTMGFSALDGLPMGTRCGQIDPGVLLYLLNERGMSPAQLQQMLYRESGLLGLSGFSSDMRDLLAATRPEAQEAIEYYVTRARREIGALAAVMGGLDGLVFCGGIGENAAEIRRRITDGLGFLGITLDPERNAENAREIAQGPTRVLVFPTDEERVIARAVQKLLD